MNYRLFAKSIAFIMVLCLSTFTYAVDSTSLPPASSIISRSVNSYVLASGNDIFVATWYYGAPDTLLGTTAKTCPSGFTPQLSLSTFKTQDSDSISGGCQMYGINAYGYFVQSGNSYKIYANSHIRYPSSCPDKGIYVSYVFICQAP